ncbi:hypothetical protein [Candidatus Poriferisodalis sp.]|uniref:hypothetical protein n=1 Tax=Candidatus Poriferisodalis sp. TaxID=3101277 RepID=UPI003B02611E
MTAQRADDASSAPETESDDAETAAAHDASDSATADHRDSSADESSSSDAAESDDDNGAGGTTETEAEQGEPHTAEPAPELVRWDRAKLEALFPHCPPPYAGDADVWARWFGIYDEFTEAHLDRRHIAPKWPRLTSGVLPALYARISRDGYRPGDDASDWAHAEGIVPPRDISHMTQAQIAAVLHDWMSYRHQFAPEGDHAPAAWGLRIVAEVSSLSCVANTMRSACGEFSDLTHPFLQKPHLRYDADSSSLGRALWSIVCGQAPTEERLGGGS